ncbi:hypothetical protein [Bacillus seohaeanensis]|jgi:transposase|uniref:Transposase n=1 Tax=Bacillus seohaeanensis TaxID=284580 RepID=A0ABW5RTX5_9BACI
MAKFSIEEKLAVIRRYKEGTESYLTIGRAIGTSDSVPINWA